MTPSDRNPSNTPYPVEEVSATPIAEPGAVSTREVRQPATDRADALEQKVEKAKSDDELAQSPDEAHLEDFLWNVHRYTNDYIRFADVKAGFCVGLESAVLGSAIRAHIQDLFLTRAPRDWTPLGWMAMVGFTLLSIGIVAAAWAVKPRLRNPRGQGYIFWGAIRQYGVHGSFWASLSGQSRTDLNGHLAEHLFVLATVCTQKYRWVSISVIAGGVGSALAAVAILFR